MGAQGAARRQGESPGVGVGVDRHSADLDQVGGADRIGFQAGSAGAIHQPRGIQEDRAPAGHVEVPAGEHDAAVAGGKIEEDAATRSGGVGQRFAERSRAAVAGVVDQEDRSGFEGADIGLADAGEAALIGGRDGAGRETGVDGRASGQESHRLGGPAVAGQRGQTGVDWQAAGPDLVGRLGQARRSGSIADQVSAVADGHGAEQIIGGGGPIAGDQGVGEAQRVHGPYSTSRARDVARNGGLDQGQRSRCLNSAAGIRPSVIGHGGTGEGQRSAGPDGASVTTGEIVGSGRVGEEKRPSAIVDSARVK